MVKKILSMLFILAVLPIASFVSNISRNIVVEESFPNVNGNFKKMNSVSLENIQECNTELEVAHLLSQSIDGTSFSIELLYDSNVKNVIFDSDDVSLQSQTIVGNKVDLNLTTGVKSTKMKVMAELVNNIQVVKSIFTYKYMNQIYVSDLSIDTAWYNAMVENFNAGTITDGEVIDEYKAFSRESIPNQSVSVVYNESAGIQTLSSSSGKETYVEGVLKWTDEDENEHPLRNTKVMLYEEEPLWIGILMAETYTDSNGYFRFAFENADQWYQFENGGLDPFIRVCAEAETFSVRRDWIFNYLTIYDVYSNTASNVKTGSTTTFNITIPKDKDNMCNNAFSISQGMSYGQRLANEIGNLPIKSSDIKYRLNVAYPATTNSFSFEMFSGINKNHYNDWSVVIHEYGHYVEGVMGTYGNNLLEIIENNPSHSLNENHFDSDKDKDFSMKLTWSESWAYVFAMICYDYYPELANIANASPIKKDYIDAYEPFSPDYEGGEAQEKTVIAYLWDLYDDENENNDNIALGTAGFWNATVKPGIYDLTDFISSFSSFIYLDSNGKLLEKHQIAPANLSLINSMSENTPPRFRWRPNGSESHPNNLFELLFYSMDGNVVFRKKNISLPVDIKYNGNMTYELSLEDWQKVLVNFGGTSSCKVAVRGYETTKGLTSGPYSSSSIELKLPTKSVYLDSSFRYYEDTAYIPKNGTATFYFTFGVSGTRIFQTFGPLDTFLMVYDERGEYLNNDDESGYDHNAYLKFDVVAGKKYRIVVSLYNEEDSGNIRFSVTPALGAQRHDATEFETYDDIWELGNVTNYRFYVFLAKYYSLMVRCRPATTAFYQIETESEFDAYLYVIDPRSASLITFLDYNDDGVENNGDAKVTKYLEEGVSYLIILARFDNAAEFTDYDKGDDIVLKVNKV